MYFYIFVLALFIGSFLNSYTEQDFDYKNYNYSMELIDYLPLVNIFRYRNFKNKPSKLKYYFFIQKPILELLNAIFYTFTFYYYELSWEFIFHNILFSLLLVVSLIDIKYYIIPNKQILFLFFIAFIYKLLNFSSLGGIIHIYTSIISMILTCLFFSVLSIISHGGFGGGDIKLFSVLGFILGYKKILLNVFISFLIGGIFSVLLILLDIKSKGDIIPFGPFINIGFFITLIYGENILNWYSSIFLI